jgi:uncharacterized protein
MQKPQVWPVIHYLTDAIAMDNAAMAAELGAAGVLLISMESNDGPLIPVAKTIKAQHPAMKVGVNHLTLPAEVSLEHNLHAGLDATWTDRPGVSSSTISDAAKSISQRLSWHPDHLFFASVAFKYQAPEPAPGLAAAAACAIGMIPTSSGRATGVAADVSKLRIMHDELVHFARTAGGERSWPKRSPTDLGLASGVTPENVADVVGLVSHVLVATGISSDEHHFDYEKLARLMGKIASTPLVQAENGSDLRT